LRKNPTLDLESPVNFLEIGTGLKVQKKFVQSKHF